jgi:hypothetical protein
MVSKYISQCNSSMLKNPLLRTQYQIKKAKKVKSIPLAVPMMLWALMKAMMKQSTMKKTKMCSLDNLRAITALGSDLL